MQGLNTLLYAVKVKFYQSFHVDDSFMLFILSLLYQTDWLSTQRNGFGVQALVGRFQGL